MIEFLQSKIRNPKSKITTVIYVHLCLFFTILFLIGTYPTLADDVGITKARLIQKSAKR